MGNICTVSVSVDELISQCWKCTTEPAFRIRKFEENLNSLKNKLRELQADKNDIIRRVEISERQEMQKLDKVEWWISRVEILETQVNKLMAECEDDQKDEKKLWFKYKMGQKISTKLTELDVLIRQGQFGEVAAGKTFPPWLERRPSVPTVGLQSTVDSVWNRVTQDDEVGVIGIYGMAGVGKTTLMTQINNQLVERPHNFDCVIWIIVSNDARMEKIQHDIAEKIGCYNPQWYAKTMDEKAMSIFRVLQEKKFVLLFDDVWERIDLEMLGIPFPDTENKSKVVFTTRSEIVCGKMEAQTKIKVDCLAWKEAWELFQRKVGGNVLNLHPEILEIAQDVAKQCGGLPLALITIGRAMACKQTPQEWRYAREVLKQSAAEFSGMEEEVLSLLKFSYDNLADETIKSCFLYIALFPKDLSIRSSNLIDCWIGEGFLEKYGSTDDAHHYGHYIIGTLIQACLLEYCTPPHFHKSYVKMHDVVREMALWNTKDSFIVQAGVQLITPEVGKWLLARKVSLMHNKIEKLIEAPKCLHLSTLLLGRNYNLKSIGHSFFEFMPSLRVLDLSNNSLAELPLAIAKLLSLQYLNLSRNKNLRQLPSRFGDLVKLKYLNLNRTRVRNISDEIISGLTLLQVLKLASFMFAGDDTYLTRLEGFPSLDYLDITVTCIPTFQRLTSTRKLQKYTRCLWIYNFQSSELNISSLANMKSLSELIIRGCKMQDLTADFITDGSVAQSPDAPIINTTCFHNLVDVQISSCLNLRDSTWLVFAPNLKSLSISFCPKMEDVICHERCEQVDLFGKLEFLSLNSLYALKSISWKTLPLLQLKKIQVRDCQQLKKLPLNSSSANAGKLLVIKGENSWWDNLQWEDDDSRNAFLPCFRLIKL